MGLGRSPKQEDLLRSTRAACEARLWERSIYRLLARCWPQAVSDQSFADLFVRFDRRREDVAADSGWIFPSKVGKPHDNTSCMSKAFEDCLKKIGVERRFSSHGLRRTANDRIRWVASGEVARAITGHVTERMTEHYSHVVGEKKAAVEGMLKLVKGGKAEAVNDTSKQRQDDSKQALN